LILKLSYIIIWQLIFIGINEAAMIYGFRISYGIKIKPEVCKDV